MARTKPASPAKGAKKKAATPAKDSPRRSTRNKSPAKKYDGTEAPSKVVKPTAPKKKASPKKVAGKKASALIEDYEAQEQPEPVMPPRKTAAKELNVKASPEPRGRPRKATSTEPAAVTTRRSVSRGKKADRVTAEATWTDSPKKHSPKKGKAEKGPDPEADVCEDDENHFHPFMRQASVGGIKGSIEKPHPAYISRSPSKSPARNTGLTAKTTKRKVVGTSPSIARSKSPAKSPVRKKAASPLQSPISTRTRSRSPNDAASKSTTNASLHVEKARASRSPSKQPAARTRSASPFKKTAARSRSASPTKAAPAKQPSVSISSGEGADYESDCTARHFENSNVPTGPFYAKSRSASPAKAPPAQRAQSPAKKATRGCPSSPTKSPAKKRARRHSGSPEEGLTRSRTASPAKKTAQGRSASPSKSAARRPSASPRRVRITSLSEIGSQLPGQNDAAFMAHLTAEGEEGDRLRMVQDIFYGDPSIGFGRHMLQDPMREDWFELAAARGRMRRDLEDGLRRIGRGAWGRLLGGKGKGDEKGKDDDPNYVDDEDAMEDEDDDEEGDGDVEMANSARSRRQNSSTQAYKPQHDEEVYDEDEEMEDVQPSRRRRRSSSAQPARSPRISQLTQQSTSSSRNPDPPSPRKKARLDLGHSPLRNVSHASGSRTPSPTKEAPTRLKGGKGPAASDIKPGRGWVISCTNPEKVPGMGEKENPFHETMPGPEVWHRRMPPFLPFGETPYMERVMSGQIDRDLKGKDSSSSSSPRKDSTGSGILGQLTSWFNRDQTTVGEEEGQRRPSPWALPEVDEGEVERLAATFSAQRRKPSAPSTRGGWRSSGSARKKST